jgi:hypothetical protein
MNAPPGHHPFKTLRTQSPLGPCRGRMEHQSFIIHHLNWILCGLFGKEDVIVKMLGYIRRTKFEGIELMIL